MELVVILLSLVSERFVGSLEGFRDLNWFRCYVKWFLAHLFRSRWLEGPAGVLLILLLPLLLLAWIDYYLQQMGVVTHSIFSVAILLLCFGPVDLDAQVAAYIDAVECGDSESANDHAVALLGSEPSDAHGLRIRQIVDTILIEANGRLFAVLFWFLLLGPFGAVLYRLATCLEEYQWDGERVLLDRATKRLRAILDWPSVRICALIYALVGSFVEAVNGWRGQGGAWLENNREVLIAAGLGALGYTHGEENEEGEHGLEMVHAALAMVHRMVATVVGFVALLVLIGWFS